MQVNEITDYQDNRMIGSCEAAWRILGFDTNYRSVGVKALGIHEENLDTLIFRAINPRAALDQTTTLIRYLNRSNIPEMDNLTYIQFYEVYKEYTIDVEGAIPCPVGKKWLRKRKRGIFVARIYWIHPNAGDLFYLRNLLIHFPARSFRELRTVRGVHYETAQAACKAHGLLTGLDEHLDTLREADKEGFRGAQIRRFFISLIIGQGAPARVIWDELKDLLAEDFLINRQMGHNKDWAYNQALIDIARLLEPHGRTLENINLPPARDDTTEASRERRRWTVEDMDDYVEEWKPNLTLEQRGLYETLLEAIENQTEGSPRKTFMIDAMGGAGKTVVLKLLAATVRSRGKIALCSATTGIAALNFHGGMTAHSLFK